MLLISAVLGYTTEGRFLSLPYLVTPLKVAPYLCRIWLHHRRGAPVSLPCWVTPLKGRSLPLPYLVTPLKGAPYLWIYICIHLRKSPYKFHAVGTLCKHLQTEVLSTKTVEATQRQSAHVNIGLTLISNSDMNKVFCIRPGFKKEKKKVRLDLNVLSFVCHNNCQLFFFFFFFLLF